jgi:branched-chain amino acid aminotransferase
MPTYANWNGVIVREDEINISVNNRSFRYGDGCFETMKVVNGQLLLADFHFRRLLSSLETLKFSIPSSFTGASFINNIMELVEAKREQGLSRIRMVCFRGQGGLYENEGNLLNYIIQSSPGNPATNVFNKKGLVVGFYPDAKKSVDLFSSIKSNNFLGYSMGALWAKEKGFDDCILCNAYDRIADATIANVFIVKDGLIKTVPINEGCINGVMRKYLITCLSKQGIPFTEEKVTRDDILGASEVFLTNANFGIRWVEKIEQSNYNFSGSSLLHQMFIDPLFNSQTF